MTKVGRSMLALVLATSLALVACGGGSGDGLKKAATTDDTADGSLSAADLKGLPAKCIAAASAMASAMTGAFTGTDLAASVKQLEAVAKASPKEIQSDLALITAAYAGVSKILKEAGYDPKKPPTTPAEQAKVTAALEEAGKLFDNEKLNDASDRVETWFDTECKKS
jgi:hypothetical protein